MPADARAITAADILPYGQYAAERAERRRALLPLKKRRRVEVGPYASFYFENFTTMLAQVQEMLHIEKGGDAQLADELAAYNPLIPQGDELVATLMFEISDPDARLAALRQLGGIEHHVFIEVGGIRIAGRPEDDAERTRQEDNKTSAVHFLRFGCSAAAIAGFKDRATPVTLGFDHDAYGHQARLSAATRAALAEDFAG